MLYKDLAKDMRTWRERHEDRTRDIQDMGTIHEDLGYKDLVKALK